MEKLDLLSHLRKTQKLDKTMVFRYWATDNTQQWYLTGEANKLCPTTALAYYLGIVFRTQHKEGETRQSPVVSQSWKDWAGRPRQLDFSGQSTRDERAAQRKHQRFKQGPFQVFSWVPISTYTAFPKK